MAMVPRYFLAPVTLFLVQNAPVAVVPDSNGSFRIAVGAELGSYLERTVSCSGEILDRERVKFRTGGGELEAWLSPTVRVVGHAGQMSATAVEGGRIAPPFEGFFAGGLIGYEGEKLGVGGGVSTAPIGEESGSRSHHFVPLGYFRAGPLDRVHLRLDLGGPAAPGAPPDRFRLGLAGGQGWIRKPSWQAYIGAGDFPRSGSDVGLVVGARVAAPVSSVFELGVAGALRSPSGGNFGVFGRAHFKSRQN